MKHLHLPHPHLPDISEIATEVLREARLHLRRPKPVYTDPVVVARWARMFRHHETPPTRAVPAAQDWPEWHYAPPTQVDWENEQ